MMINQGIVAVFKPVGISSYDVIRRIKKHLPGEKIGHGGTLDPAAEGVLVIGIGKDATRQLQHVLKGTEKEYEATIILGKVSETDDSEGPIVDFPEPADPPSESQIIQIVKDFIGEIMQVPPKYSALKINGVPAYKRARRGEDFEIPARPALINDIKIIRYQYPELKIRVSTGSGVYIRALARDIGNALHVGGYMSALTRTRVGDYRLEDAIEID